MLNPNSSRILRLGAGRDGTRSGGSPTTADGRSLISEFRGQGNSLIVCQWPSSAHNIRIQGCSFCFTSFLSFLANPLPIEGDAEETRGRYVSRRGETDRKPFVCHAPSRYLCDVSVSYMSAGVQPSPKMSFKDWQVRVETWSGSCRPWSGAGVGTDQVNTRLYGI